MAGFVLLVSVLCALGLRSLSSPTPALWLVAGPALVALGYLVAQGPRWCLLALVAAVVFGLYQDALSAGPTQLRIDDLFFVALAVWALRTRSGQGRLPVADVGQRQIALLVGALAISLYPLIVHAGSDLSNSVIAWIRIVETVSLVWLVPYALRQFRDFDFLLRGLALMMSLELVGAIVVGALDGTISPRLSGANGPNATGLLAALLIVLAVHFPVSIHRWQRWLAIVIGVTALILTKSLGSTAAVAAALAIYGFRPPDTRPFRKEGLVRPLRVLLLVIAVLALAGTLRPQNLPDSAQFGDSTTVHRALLATAGFQVFLEHPITGIGWQQATTGGSLDRLNARLEGLFGDEVNAVFYPRTEFSQYHNAYMQVLGQAGLIGFLALLAAAFAIARGAARILRNTRPRSMVYARARCAVIMFFVIAIWWNDNGLYGGQPESVLAAVLLGMLAAIPLGAANLADVP